MEQDSGVRDSLTGLKTRPALEADLRRALKESAASVRKSVALATLDVDHFKQVNDQFGVDAGDCVLRSLADLLEAEAPGNAYRLSGDEFALLLPGLSLGQAFLRMEALRVRVEDALRRLDLPAGNDTPADRSVTITAGVAHCPRDARDVPGLFKAADAALQSAKDTGRNQVGLPPNQEMVMKSSYYPAASVRKLKNLAERTGRKESHLLREALGDLLRKYDTAPQED